MIISVHHKYSGYYQNILKMHQLFQLSSTDVTFKQWGMTLCLYRYFKHTHYMAQVIPICQSHNGSPSLVAKLVKSIKTRSASLSLLVCGSTVGKGSQSEPMRFPIASRTHQHEPAAGGEKVAHRRGEKRKVPVQETGKGTELGQGSWWWFEHS